ncbi:type 2 lanthipeptide synthetase LanM family protein [Priestia flexa]|uniref:type 2 lanthipeptide synthetase LanM family protein n=1 Tax=Priestia flexa TaxID=86664 RepID=UPI00095615ED|nr:type 2 lanthipeptide synthetase LanM family protein [Priestia flexa]SIR56657.1 type 2 lantibiotic biosynthesis protein LanM [Priestia flexa]
MEYTISSSPLSNYLKTLYNSLTVKERYELIQKNTNLLTTTKLTSEEANLFLNEWKSVSLLDEEKLNKKLSSEELSTEEFCKILKISSNDDWMNYFNVDIKPKWLEAIEESLILNREQPVKYYPDQNISLAFRPFLLWFQNKMNTYFNKNTQIKNYVIEESLLNSLLHNLIQGLTNIGARTVVLEMHVAKKLNELKGETPEERYKSFINTKLSDSKFIEFIYQEYPVLSRILMTRTMYYYENIIEALQRFEKDRKEIVDYLTQKEGRLTEIKAGMGDSHQKGQTVMRFKLDTDEEIIYKPKSLKIIKHFNSLLEWINQKGFHPNLKTYNSIIRSNYSWEECISPKDCKTNEEVINFYERLGGYLATLYLLNGTDFHHENIIANGEYPLLIDLETIFHHIPELNFKDTAQFKAKLKIANSVLGTAILPSLFFKAADGKGIDISGVSSTDQELPIPLLQVENDGTDEMIFVRKTAKISGESLNVPKLNGEIVHITDYIDSVLTGFKNVSHIFIQNKEELLEPHGPIDAFKNVEIRIINRPTQYYGNFLLESHHPNYMKDGLNKEMLLDRLWFTVLDHRPIPFEIQSLFEGDIPMFITQPNSYNLVSSNNDVIKNYYKRTSYEQCVEKINSFSFEEMNKQSNWIKASLQANSSSKQHNREDKAPFNNGHLIKINKNQMLMEAKRIGDYLEQNAIYSDYEDVAWIGLETNYYGQWQVTALDDGLYNGLSGIGLFLAYLGYSTNEDKYHNLAKKVEKTILSAPTNQKGLVSAFYGKASSLYMLYHFNKIYGENKERNIFIQKVLKDIEISIKDDNLYDILGGSAGTIQVLLNLYEQTNDKRALQVAETCGNHLIDNSKRLSTGVGWPSVTDSKPLGGFSHGTSGIAFSLIRLYLFTKKKMFLDVALEAIKYDNSLFDIKLNNWKDMRNPQDNKQIDSFFWCHGASGIGLSRILYMQLLANYNAVDAVETAIENTIKAGMGRTHALCHGDLGNTELLLKASEYFNNKDLLQQAQVVGMNVINYYEKHNYYKTGVNGNVEMPGFMLGLSGIGYQLLRLTNPDKFPSILTLE